MNTNGHVRTNEPDVAASFADLTHDVIELAELQTKLLKLDVKETSQKAQTSAILAVAGACVLLGTIPVLLCTVAYLLIEFAQWPHWAGFGVATLVGLVIGGGVLAAAYAKFKNGIGSMERSSEELRRNIEWVKSSLRSRCHTNPVERS
jgi:hypothetical protein